MTTDVSRWGNSLAIRIPKPLADQLRLAEGDPVSMEAASDGSLVIRPARVRYRLEELVAGITPGNRHPETAWKTPVGREAW